MKFPTPLFSMIAAIVLVPGTMPDASAQRSSRGGGYCPLSSAEGP